MLNRIDFQINLCSNFPSHLLVEIDGMCVNGWLIWARGQRHLRNLSDENEKKQKKKTSSPSPRNAQQKACSSFCRCTAWEPKADVAHLPSNFREKLRKTKQKEKKKKGSSLSAPLRGSLGASCPPSEGWMAQELGIARGKNQQWPCQRWQLSGKQSIKAGTTCHLHSFFFCKLLACFFRTEVIHPPPQFL